MKRCVYCGKENNDSNKYCINCGEDLSGFNKEKTEDSHIKQEIIDGPIYKENAHTNNTRCPNCNSKRIAYLTKSTDGFSGSNACCGYIIFGPLGLLCGLSGKQESLTVRKCMDCGNEF